MNLDDRFRARLPRIAAASGAMGCALWAALWWLAPWFDGSQGQRIAGLVILVAAGIGIYGLLAFGLGAVRRADLRDLLRRSAGQETGSQAP